MKNTILIILSILGVSQAMTQNNPNDPSWVWSDPGYLPTVREGVKWVNEKVIINHNDTTKYYYIYEFRGQDNDPRWTNLAGQINNACYYYTGIELDTEKDSLIAGLRDDGEVTFMRNNAYFKLLDENRLMFHLDMYTDGGTRILYYYKLMFSNCINYYLSCQNYSHERWGYDEILNRENFTEVDSIEIEGKFCSRYAYVKESGDTMCYVIEGIGFDSRNMGDLLTPFTREPDPDADYQEYCGLCHVIKDGQIIYKGMRYTPDNMTGLDEVVTDQRPRQYDNNYYNLMGQPVGKVLPTTPGIYIHHGKKIVVNY